MQFRKKLLYTFILLVAVLMINKAGAQVTDANKDNYQLDNQGRPMPRTKSGNDSLKLRDKYEDSITITYKYFDSSLIHHIDTSINDFSSRLQKPFTYNNTGNIGSPAESLLFNPYMKPGWDAGFHSMDVYKFTVENTKYYTTTRPYSVVGYMLGGKGEQYIDLLHTQPRAKGNVNFTFEYRLLNAPGALKNENDANSNLRVNLAIHSSNKRYSSNFIFIRNSLKAATNGGLVNPADLHNLTLGSSFAVNTRLGSSNSRTNDPFNTTVTTGNITKDVTLYFRQSYDFGQKDSLVKDTITYRLFYPRLRLEHSIKYTNYDYSFVDNNPIASDYLNYFDLIVPTDTINFHDNWKELNNEFAIYTYPDKKNTNQFLKLHANLQSLNGSFGKFYKQKYNNVYVGAEYRNRTRNQKWDVTALGDLYVAGNYTGNYSASLSLRRDLGKKLGSLQLGFQNVNRTPSYIFNAASSTNLSLNDTANISFKSHSDFPIINTTDFKNENISKAYAVLYLPELQMKLTGNYFLYNNYSYFSNYFTAEQSNTAFNLLQLGVEKETKLGKYFRWYLEAYVQKKAGNTPVNLPFFLMRNRIAFEGNFYTNLDIATGFEVRYASPYKPDIYSPFTAQFFNQNTQTISNLPDVSFYVNFKITRFNFFGEIANLNTLSYKNKTFGFNNYSFVAPNYPSHALWIRLGVWWTFIN
ncbi:putative porin [Arachidicoccus sp.]|uniref:putative porin n=1 Tax=Arachidicoccus sp. TaxID=1872624 RepID=UPI003D221354